MLDALELAWLALLTVAVGRRWWPATTAVVATAPPSDAAPVAPVALPADACCAVVECVTETRHPAHRRWRGR